MTSTRDSSHATTRATDPHQCLAVPVHQGELGTTLRLGRLPSGERVGLAFTSLARLRAALGRDQEHLELRLAVLHAYLAPLGVDAVQVDGRLDGQVSDRARQAPGPRPAA